MADQKVGLGQIVGIGLSFGVTMALSIFIMYEAGHWIDGKLGLNGVFAFIGILMGIFSGFRLLLESVRSLERPRGREYDAWKAQQVEKQRQEEARREAEKLAKKERRQAKRAAKKAEKPR